jgi:hypothetical protein
VQADVQIGTTTSHSLYICPNPSQGPLSINTTDAEISVIEIYNLLGDIIASHEHSNYWNWDGKTISGEHVEPGTYFVRTVGVRADRKPFVQTAKLMVR